MARTLALIRHAKAQDTHPQGDHERELIDKGHASALDLGRRLGEAGLRPDHVLVSTAVRARQTLDGLLGGAGVDAATVDVRSERRVFDGGLDATLEAIAETPDEAHVLWVVGHEPVMSACAWELLDRLRLSDDFRTRLDSGLKTATALALTLADRPRGAWDVTPGTGTVRELSRGVHEPTAES